MRTIVRGIACENCRFLRLAVIFSLDKHFKLMQDSLNFELY